jgi:ABC-2 type transport system ATP-binding protein
MFERDCFEISHGEPASRPMNSRATQHAYHGDQRDPEKISRGPPTLVRVEGAVHSFGDRPVLRGVDLDLRSGEIYGLLGPNGAGKTTLMKAICGRLRLTSGRVAIAGRNPLSNRSARQAVSFVPQEISIYPYLTVSENLHVFGRFAGLRGRDLIAAVDTMLERAGLVDRADQLCRTLSGGYQRRVNICASMLHNPVALLLDEPTVGIDVDAREAIHGLLEGLCDEGAALMISTHDLEQAQLLCNRIGIMQNGQLCLEGEPAALLRWAFGTDREVIASLRGPPYKQTQIQFLRDLGFRPTQSPLTWFGRAPAGHLDAGALAQHISTAGLVVKEVRVRNPDLGSLFLAVLGREFEP